ncbi:MAG: hypothetical protein H7Z41_13000 [Cytophagales bacterium]|nr:hypothetical protein [Armatimonadota bacterium]
MIISDGTHHYEWIEPWASTPDTPPSRENGRTHGVAESKTGEVYVFHQSTPAVLVFDSQGGLIRTFGDEYPRAHGLRLVEATDGTEYLWLTDEVSGRVAKVTLRGETVQTIEKPDLPIYAGGGKYSPTWAEENPANGDIWVADGYGSSLVHRHDKSGSYLSSLDGTEGAAGKFSCPHSIFFDTRGGKEPELYITDRANRRIQVYDGSGTFKRAFGAEFLIHPCDFAVHGEFLYIPELFGRLAVLDGADHLVGYLGENRPISEAGAKGWPGGERGGWPNLPADQILKGQFNSPHGVGTGADGSIYVVEWIAPGGRIVKLAPV